MLSLPGAWVQSLLRELRSCKLFIAVKRDKMSQQKNVASGGSRGESVSFPFLEATCIPWLTALHHPSFCSHGHISYSDIEKCWSLSCVQLFVTLWTVAHQAPLSMGILQARILEWVDIPFSGGSYQPRDRTLSPSLEADSLLSEPPGKTLICLPLKRALGLYCCCCQVASVISDSVQPHRW